MEQQILFGYYFRQCFNRWRMVVHGWHPRHGEVEPRSIQVTAVGLAEAIGSGVRIGNGIEGGAIALDLVIDWSQIGDAQEVAHQLVPILIQWKNEPGRRIFHTAELRVPTKVVGLLTVAGCWQSET